MTSRAWMLAGILISGICLAQLPSSEEARALDAEGAGLAEAGKIGEAVEQFRKALLLAPGFPEARYHLGLAYDRLGQTDEAMVQFEAALGLRADFLQARYLLAGCCRKRGDFEGEMRLLAGIVQAAPAFSEARFNYGLALQRIEKTVEAIEQLRAAVLGDPRNFRYLLALGIALADQNPGEAVALLRRAVQQSPGRAETHYNLALAMAAAGDNAGAIGEFATAIRLEPAHAGARRGLGVALMREDRLTEAAAELRRACDTAPSDAEAANNLGLVLLRLKDLPGAASALERAVRINPKLIKAHFNLAQAYQRAGRAAAARIETDLAKKLTAEQRSLGRSMVLVQSGRQRLNSGDRNGALSALREAVAECAAFAEAHLELGRAILDTGGDPNAAIREFKLAVNLDPERADVHYQIGLASLKAGDKQHALEEFRSAAAMAPCRTEIMRALGEAALAIGDRSTAERQFSRMVAWDPEDGEARAQLAKVRASM